MAAEARTTDAIAVVLAFNAAINGRGLAGLTELMTPSHRFVDARGRSECSFAPLDRDASAPTIGIVEEPDQLLRRDKAACVSDHLADLRPVRRLVEAGADPAGSTDTWLEEPCWMSGGECLPAAGRCRTPDARAVIRVRSVN